MPKNTTTETFTAAEKDAINQRAAEVRAAKRGKAGLDDLLDKIAAMAPHDRRLAERLHALITETAPWLTPRTWYGMPAYAAAGKVVCFFQESGKFKTRYATLGFQDAATLDDGPIWPTAYAVADLTPEAEEKIVQLIERAAPRP